MSNSDLSSAIAQGLQHEAVNLAERLAARSDDPSLKRAAELLAIMAAVPTVDLRPHLEWALRRISTSLGEGEHFAAALLALEEAQQPAPVAPVAGHADILQVGYWLSHQQLRPAGSFDINPLFDELKSEGWSEAPVFVGMPTLQVTFARGNEGDLAALVKRLVRALRKAEPGNEMGDLAMDYLKRQGLLGSPLRDAFALEASAAGVQAVRDGWKLVPMEPTAEMVAAACRDHGYPGGTRSVYVHGYRSMLAAAPQAAAAPEPAEPAVATLFEHEDGRHAVWKGAGSPPWTYGDPKWHRVGPVEVSSSALANATAPGAVAVSALGLSAELVRLADIRRDCGRLDDVCAVDSEQILRAAATLLGAAPPGAVLDIPSPAAPSMGPEAAEALKALREMWDELEKFGRGFNNSRAMRYYSDALSTIERSLAAPAAPVGSVVASLAEARHAVAAIVAVGNYNEQEVILRASALKVFDCRSVAALAKEGGAAC